MVAGTPGRQGFWLTAGEIVGVLALIIAGLNFWDSHQQRVEEARRERAQKPTAAPFVVVGEADAEGRVIDLHPLRPGQAIQSERFRFPAEVRDHPVDLTAERPRIDADWVGPGLKHALEAVHARSNGEARVPMLIATTYVEDGDTRTDVSLYQLGLAWKHVFLTGFQVRLTGLALSRRALGADAAVAEKQVEEGWRKTKAGLAGAPASPPA